MLNFRTTDEEGMDKQNEETKEYDMCETDSERSMCVRYHNLVGKLTLHLLHAKTTDICGSPY